MNIYIDVSVLTLATFVTGIQRVTREIAVRLISAEQDNIVLLHYNAKENRYHRIDNQRFCDYYLQGKGIKNRMITDKIIELSEIGEGDTFFDLDAAWMCRVKRSYLLPILKEQGARIVAHIYDIISITHPQYCLERGVYNFMDFIAAHLKYADEIIVNAQATIEELSKLASRIGIDLPVCHVVPLGADFGTQQKIEDKQVSPQLVSVANEKPYILMVGTLEPRKNNKLLLKAYDNGLKELGYNIIMAGYMGWNMENFAEQLKMHPDYGQRIFHMEGLCDTEITYLYQQARFLAFCSYTEGFGLPIIESIMRGTPVIAADIPVLREVGGECCIWFEQDDVDEFCKRVIEFTENEKKYTDVRERLRNFRPTSWKESFEKISLYLHSSNAKDNVEEY